MRKRKGTSTQKLAWLFFSLHPLSRNSLPNPRQDPGWTERHVAAYANIAGPTLGAAKSLPALLSGETRDTAELGAVAAFLGENYVPRGLRASLFRTWPGAYGMLPLGGSRVWGRPLAQAGRGDENKSSASFSGGAPDDTPAMRRRGVSHGALLTVDGQQMDVARALRVLSDSLPAHAAAHVAEALAAAASGGGGGAAGGDGGAAAPETPCHGGAVDPLRCPLPLAPSMRLYCIYGTGKPTERAYSYVKTPPTAEPATAASEGREAARGSSTAASAATAAAQAAEELRIDTDASEDARDVAESAVDDEDEEEEGKGGGEGGGGRGGGEEDAAPSPPASAPARSSRSLGSLENGVRVSDGDGTVPLISLGTLCARHWRADPRDPKRKGSRLNPSNLSVVTREARHSPRDFLLGGTLDPRGGDGSADHVDILMNAGVLEDVIAIVSGRGGELSDKIFSRIREIAARVEI